jgi:hypothetical protein
MSRLTVCWRQTGNHWENIYTWTKLQVTRQLFLTLMPL